MRRFIIALLVGVALFATVWVLAVASAITDPAAGGDANGTGSGWEDMNLFGSP